MGANCYIYLPNDIDADDIVEAIGIICGAEKTFEKLSLSNSYACFVNRQQVSTSPNDDSRNYLIRVNPTHHTQFLEIFIKATDLDEESHWGSLFLYPSSEREGYYLLSGGPNKFWRTVGRALVKFFGGKVDDDDCDSVDVNYRKPKPRKSNHPSGGKEWQDYQRGMYELPVLCKFLELK